MDFVQEEWESYINANKNGSLNEKCTVFTSKNTEKTSISTLPKCDDLYISTTTKVLFLNEKIDINNVFWEIPIIEYWRPVSGVIKKQMKIVSHTKEEYELYKNKLQYISYYTEHVIKSIDNPTVNINDEKEIALNPLNSSIADGLSRRTEERKIKLKEFNYNFNKAKNLINMENEPAFKRAGINFDSVEKIKDSKGEINLQIDKSFLHDNVD